MAARIEATLGFKPKLIPGGGGIFDVQVNGQIIYSKFETGTFPDEKQLAKEIASRYQ